MVKLAVVIPLAGVLAISSTLPVMSVAQVRVPPPPASPRIAVTLRSPAPAPVNERLPHRDPFLRQRSAFGGWSLPWLVVHDPTPVAAAPVPVPLYYPVPVTTPPSRRLDPVPEKPYNPAASRITVEGAGADGGGGIMRVRRGHGDSLHVTWLGSTRPVQRAVVFLADSLRSRVAVTTLREGVTSASFGPAEVGALPGWVGIEVTHIDGSMRTTLVPLPGW